ncbi:transglycosylase SLT domain-containing protein [Thiolapillus sp.]|uniref:transglycosylase SLT domain-containing protein n=1 Tax=Thiolapillus sp. TaxID=2017437 RepID=UPI003AF78730
MNARYRLTPALLAMILMLLAVNTAIAGNVALEAQRKLFQAAEKLSATGKPLPRQMKTLLRNYPLYPYLEYARLKHELKNASADEVNGFLRKYKDTPLPSLLRSRWLNVLAERRDWKNYIRFYTPQTNISRQCHYLQALIQTGSKEQAFSQVEPLWLYGKSRPKACDPVFKAWRQAGLLTTELVWRRIELAMNRGQIKLARFLQKSLPARERGWVDTWVRIHNKPALALTDPALKKKHPQRQKILLDAAYRQIRKDPVPALDYWKRLQKRFSFSVLEKHLVNRKLALWLTRNETAAAIDFMADLQPCSHDSKLQEALVKSALLHNDWVQVVSRIERMPEEEQQSERWSYWLARALEQTGQRARAAILYQQLAAKRSYYGFLAADRTGRPYHFSPKPSTVDKELADAISRNPAVARARELLALDRWVDARREWRFATRDLTADEYIAAAELAQSWNWHDQAIFTLAKSDYWDDLELRFPLEHLSDVKHFARKNRLDMSWVYGVIRQESAFNASVRSYAGAVGLMQLMPATARYVSKKLLKRKRSPKRRDLITPSINIELGTAYLADIFASLGDNPVLATAAYNAGPHRVKRWMPKSSLPADIWVELIPFRETRGYVQRVFTYAAIYDHRLERKLTRLSERMLPVQGTQAAQTAQTTIKDSTAL